MRRAVLLAPLALAPAIGLATSACRADSSGCTSDADGERFVLTDASLDTVQLLQQRAAVHRRQTPSRSAEVASAFDLVYKEARQPLQISVASSEVTDGSATKTLCGYLARSFREQAQDTATLSAWPKACELPPGLALAEQGARADLTLVLLDDAKFNVEEHWAALPAGGIMAVNMSGTRVAGANLIWQSIYQLNSRLDYMRVVTNWTQDDLGLPSLQFAAFFSDHVILQKADYEEDLSRAKGDFAALATVAGTDKVNGFHNYTLLYHRHLDAFPKEQPGMMLEIGLGCTMNYGAGASARIWPKLYPNMTIHFVELNRECVDKWMPKMRELGVSKVHVGSQADPTVLAQVAREAEATPGGLRLVVDDGSHECAHIEASFRSLFPHVEPDGLYVVEDMMYSGWGTNFGQGVAQTFHQKNQHTEGTPLALAAVLASAAAGVADDVSFPPTSWTANVLVDYGPLVNFVECTPGICAFRRK